MQTERTVSAARGRLWPRPFYFEFHQQLNVPPAPEPNRIVAIFDSAARIIRNNWSADLTQASVLLMCHMLGPNTRWTVVIGHK